MSDDTDGPAPRTIAEEHSLGPMRRTIANRLQESYRNAVHVTVSRDVDAESLVRAADALDDPVSLTDVLLRALSDALDSHPAFNATFEDGTHRRYEEHNVGVAVDIDEGLVTPVVADIGSKPLGEIAADRQRLTKQVKDGEYSMSTFKGGTFTISNLGPLGVDSFNPVINPPEIAILGVGRITENVVPDGDDITRQHRLTFDLSFDHRVVDGADAARFLETLAEHVAAAEKYVE